MTLFTTFEMQKYDLANVNEWKIMFDPSNETWNMLFLFSGWQMGLHYEPHIFIIAMNYMLSFLLV